MDKHSEVELKFDAGHVDIEAFLKWAREQVPDKEVRVKCPDVYYTQGDNIVRHRHSGGAGELTVKRLKSDSTTDRVEIDLKFDKTVLVEDVHAFLHYSGWEESLILHKDAYIFWYDTEDRAPTTLSLYSTLDTTFSNKRTFIEIEVEKDAPCSVRKGLQELTDWGNILMYRFNLSPAINQSIYELYKGIKYAKV